MLKTIIPLFFSLFALHFNAHSQNLPFEFDQYLKEQHAELGLQETDLKYSVSSHYASTHTGVEHLYLQQNFMGLPIRGAVLNANFSSSGEVLSVGNRFVADVDRKASTAEAVVSVNEALTYALSMFGPQIDGRSIRPAEVQKLQLLEQDGTSYSFAPSHLALEPIRVWQEWLPVDEQLVRVWTVEYHTTDAQHVWLIHLNTAELELIDYLDQVIHCQFSCEENHQHIGIDEEGTTAGSYFAQQHQPSPLLEQSAPNSYNVFPFPVESPSHGTTAVVVDPVDALASPFGWHDTNAVDGPEFTITRGNNVHAYHDIFNLRRSINDEPDGGTELCFDFPYTPGLRPHEQVDAAITNLFYWNNLAHDVLYYYGFDEAAGNFQATNYTGVPDSQANDWVRAEALDGSGTNNANFFTPPDGGRGRMQMYVWNGPLPSTHQFTFEVADPSPIAGTYGYRPATFGPLLLPEDDLLNLEIVEALDTTDVSGDGCDSILNPDELAGKAALIFRSGECTNFTKALTVQAAGAALCIICNSEEGSDALYTPTTGFADDSLTIPVIGLSRTTCDSLRMEIPNNVMVSLPTGVELPNPGPSGRDSDYDNLVIIHEYGHGLSNRLTGGPMLTNCLSETEQAGEGWSDFFGLVFTTDSTNNAEEPRGIATWLSEEPTDGTGIRPFPFSRDFSVDPITYENFGQVSIPHGIGSIFASALWDLYWNMADEYGFDSDIYNGTGGNNLAVQLVVDGMKLQPCNPNFLESRDAIILADSILTGGVNRCMIWETFARRGMGVGATPGGGANFDPPYTCRPFLQVSKSGFVDEELAGQELEYVLDIRNGLFETIPNAVVYDTLPTGASLVPGSSNCQITEVDGVLAIELGNLPGEAIVECTYRISTDPDLFSELDFDDDTRSFADWDRDNPILDEQWIFRNGFDFSGTRAFFANNIDTISDQIITMEDAYQLGDVRPGIILDHFYRTDEGADGGVVEISTDDGETWEDVGAENIVENGYNPVPLALEGGNPLAGRFAFHGRVDTFIRTAIDLSDYAGQTAKLRFRFGSDNEGDAEGWIIDHIYYYDQLFVAVNKAQATTDSIVDFSEVGVLMLPDPSSVNELEAVLDLSIYPNPAEDQFFLQTGQLTNITGLEVRVMDLNGRVLSNRFIDQLNGRQAMPLGGLPAGIYIIDVVADQGVFRNRLIKQ